MKKLILLGSLIISSFVFGREYTFIAKNAYCTQPVSELNMFTSIGEIGTGTVFPFRNCYNNGKKFNYQGTFIVAPDINKNTYDKIVKQNYPYVFFKDGSEIRVIEATVKSTNDAGYFFIDINDGKSNFLFSHKYAYPSRSDWED